MRCGRLSRSASRILLGSGSDAAAPHPNTRLPANPVTGAPPAAYSGGVGVSGPWNIVWTSISNRTVGPTIAMPRASMLRQFKV